LHIVKKARNPNSNPNLK